MRYCLFGLLLLIAWSCGEETIDMSLTELPSPTTKGLAKVHFSDPFHGVIVGGDMWTSGICLLTDDGGRTWTADSMSNKKILGMDVHPDRGSVVVGVDGYFFERHMPDDPWLFRRLRDWDILRDVHVMAHGYLAVGGAGLATGVIYVINADYTTDTVFRYTHELRAIDCLTEERCFVVGLGTVYETQDGGHSWELLRIRGDFFIDIQFVDDRTGYIIGASQAIFRTEDGGKNWRRLQKSNALSGSTRGFRALHFINPDDGFIVGDNGLLVRTSDAGDSWQSVSDTPDVQFNDVVVIDSTGFIIDDSGGIWSFDIR